MRAISKLQYFNAAPENREEALRSSARTLELLQGAARVRPEDYPGVLLQPQIYASLNQPDEAIEATRLGLERARSSNDRAVASAARR